MTSASAVWHYLTAYGVGKAPRRSGCMHPHNPTKGAQVSAYALHFALQDGDLE